MPADAAARIIRAMTSETLQFTTLGGQQTMELSEPDAGKQPAPIVMVAPALGVRARYYTRLCAGLAERGVAACAVDRPGLGSSPIRATRGQDWGYNELVDHYAAALDALARARPGAAILILGHSIGGQIGLMLAGRAEPCVRAVILVASGTPHFRAWTGFEAAKVRLAAASFAGIAQLLGYFPGDRLGFGGRCPKRLICEWAQVARTGAFDLGALPGEALLRAPGPPVLAIVLRGDHFAPESATRELLGRLEQREVELETWADPPWGGHHSRWPREPGFVVERVARFVTTLEQRAEPRVPIASTVSPAA